MDARCFICKNKIRDGEEYTSINNGIFSEEGDEDWVVLIFHKKCWLKFGKEATKKMMPLFEAEA